MHATQLVAGNCCAQTGSVVCTLSKDSVQIFIDLTRSSWQKGTYTW